MGVPPCALVPLVSTKLLSSQVRSACHLENWFFRVVGGSGYWLVFVHAVLWSRGNHVGVWSLEFTGEGSCAGTEPTLGLKAPRTVVSFNIWTRKGRLSPLQKTLISKVWTINSLQTRSKEGKVQGKKPNESLIDSKNIVIISHRCGYVCFIQPFIIPYPYF